MAVPAGYCRLSLVGSLAGSEIFDTSFWVLGGATNLADLQDLVDQVAVVLLTAGELAETLGALDPASSYDTLRGYAYPAGGTKAAFVAEHSLGLHGTSGQSTHPHQVAWVVTLRTAQAGRSARGRMYLPATAVQCGSNLQASGGRAASLATEWAGLFVAVDRIVLASGGNPVVSVVSFTKADALAVTAVSVDSRLDVQRRRANRVIPFQKQLEPVDAG